MYSHRHTERDNKGCKHDLHSTSAGLFPLTSLRCIYSKSDLKGDAQIGCLPWHRIYQSIYTYGSSVALILLIIHGHTPAQRAPGFPYQDTQQSMGGRYPQNHRLRTFWSFHCSVLIISSIDCVNSTVSRASETSLLLQNITDILPSPTSFSFNCILILHLVTS